MSIPYLVDAACDVDRLPAMSTIAKPGHIFQHHAPPETSCRVRGFLVLVLLLILAIPVRADDPDDQYLKIFNLIEKADTLNSKGQSEQALAKYHDAQKALENFQKAQPSWNGQLVSFRLEYVGQKIAELTPKAAKSTNEDTTQGTQGSQEESTAAASSVPEIKLLEPGTEPRKVLRLHPKAGDKQSVTLTLVMAMGIKAGEMENPVKMPAMTMTMDATVKDVSSEGDITYESVMSDAKVAEDTDAMPQVVAAMKTALGGAKGIKSTGVLSAQGVPKNSEIDVPAGADAQLRQVMDQTKDSFKNLSAPLPEEAVGQGGRWEVKQSIKSQGMTINQTTVFQIVSIEGDRVTATSTINQSAPKQKIENPAMQGVKLDLTKLTGSGKGNITFDLGHLMPSASSADSHTDMSMAMNIGNQKQTMSMKVDLNLKMEAK